MTGQVPSSLDYWLKYLWWLLYWKEGSENTCQSKAHQIPVPLLIFSASCKSGWQGTKWGSQARRAQACGTAPLHRQQRWLPDGEPGARFGKRWNFQVCLTSVHPGWALSLLTGGYLWTAAPAKQEFAQVLARNLPDGPNSFKWLPVFWLRLAELEPSSQNILVSTYQHFDGKAALAKEVSVTEIHIQKYSALVTPMPTDCPSKKNQREGVPQCRKGFNLLSPFHTGIISSPAHV